ncbi:MAG: response regulator [Desulfuromonadales bacterium]
MNGSVVTKRGTILVVDDMPDNLALMNNLLKADYRVKIANTGEKALRIAESESPPDLILLDVMMPGMDGYEVCRQLLRNPGTMNIPVIFLTARSDVVDEQKGLELGAVDYITKPVSPPIVLARVKNHLALKAMADFLRDQNQYLEREVARRTREGVAIQEIEIRNRQLEEASRMKSEFLATMSHEIRTPLNAIIGFSALTLKSGLPPRQQDYVSKIRTAGESLLTIIGDILDFSKIEAGQLTIEHIPFMLETALADARCLIQQKAADKGLILRVDTSPGVAACLIGDPHRLGQIIANLLSNAVKFTEHGAITLETTLAEQDHERIQLTFSVRDTGIGISSEQIGRLFQPFSQADGSTTRRFGGTGLGLSISKKLVELLGGEIWCESIPGQGSAFCFTAWFGIGQAGDIEQCTTADTANRNVTGEAFNFSGFRILLVEDNSINRQLVIEFLRETGALLQVAENGKEAVTMITGESAAYDLVLMDIQMPVMDGYEATRLIRSDSRFSLLPIIAMTAHAMQEEQQKIMQAGMDAQITKPIDVRIMLQTIAYFLHLQESGTPLPVPPGESGGDGREIADPVKPDTCSNEGMFRSEHEAIELLRTNIEQLDVSAALRRIDGDRHLYLWILRAFVQHQSNSATEIEEALSVEDATRALRQIHTVKGIAGTVGAVELQKLALALEKALLLSESPASVRGALDRFANALDQIMTDLTKHLTVTSDNDGDILPGTLTVAVAGASA